MKKMSPTEKLAMITKRGFDDVMNRFDDINNRMVEKKEFYEFRDKTEFSLYELKSDMGDVKGRLTRVENRLEKVENILVVIKDEVIPNHEKRITKLEMRTV